MSENNKLFKDTTGQQILQSIDKIAAAELAAAVQNAAEIEPEEFQKLVRAGIAQWLYPVGTIIVLKWTDKSNNNTQYQVPHIVAHYGHATLASGEVVPSCILVWKYLPPYGVQFSQFQAMYYSENGEPADTYYFNIPTTWSAAAAGKYHFTLTEPVPAGGQIVGPKLLADSASGWKVSTYASPSSTTPIETVDVIAGQDGTNLGDLTPAGSSPLNSIHRIGYGSNRYSQSAIRQWLNSDAAAGLWWNPQNNYDRPPDQLASKPGFLSGYEDDFLAILSPSKVVTALNTVSDSGIGTYESTYDKVFLPSLEEIFCTPQLANTEGEAWELYKRLVGQTTPAGYHPSVYDAYKMRGIEAPTGGTQYVRLRSANRGGAHNTWNMGTGGNGCSYYAYDALRGLPALEIK